MELIDIPDLVVDSRPLAPTRGARRRRVLPASEAPRRRAWHREHAAKLLAWAYLGLVCVAWVLIHVAGDRWWAATLMLFGPRWVWALPLLVVVPVVCRDRVRRRRGLGLTALASLVLLFPVMGLHIPWRKLIPASETRFRIRVLSCNIDRHELDAVEFARLIESARPDVVAIQEFSSRDQAMFDSGEWHTRRDGELFVASRYPILKADDVARGRWRGAGSAAYYELDTPAGPVPLINLHLASPHHQFEAVIGGEGDGAERVEANSAMRMEQSQMIGEVARGLGASVIVAGDFNTPPESAVFRGSWAGLDDAFGVAGWGFGRTFHTRLVATRIDHVLTGGAWRCDACWVGPDVGSAHRPLIADLRRN